MNGACSYRTERHSSHAGAGLTLEGSQWCRLDVFLFPQVAAAVSGAILMILKLENMRECSVIIRSGIGHNENRSAGKRSYSTFIK